MDFRQVINSAHYVLHCILDTPILAFTNLDEDCYFNTQLIFDFEKELIYVFVGAKGISYYMAKI